MRRFIRFAFLMTIACLLNALPALAQLEAGSITGRVTDASGAVIPNAKVVLVNTGTNLTLPTTSNAEGIFNFPALQPGIYKITAGFKGFEESVTTVDLGVGETAHADLGLTAGSTSETVTVSSGGQYQLETQSATTDFVVTKQEVLDLPLNGGNPYALAALSPGLVPLGNFGVGLTTTRGAAQTAGNANFSVNGGISGNNEILIDGVPTIVCCQGQPSLTPSIAIIEQMRAITSVPPAQYGRTSGGVLNYSTFSGTNRLHGQVFEFFQNQRLHAANWFVKADQDPLYPDRPGDYRLPLRYNQYGIGVGGPVVIPHLYNGHDKTFFHAAFDGIDASVGAYSKASVPDQWERTGDFSHEPGIPANSIYNPTSNPRTYFPGNVIPSGDINPVALAYMNFFPPPSGGQTGVTDNYNSTTVNRSTDRQFSLRIDHEISPRQRVFMRATYDYNHYHQPDYDGDYNGINAKYQNIAGIVSALQDTWMLSNKTVLTMQYGFAYQSNAMMPMNYLNFTPASAGFSNNFSTEQEVQGLPEMSIDGFSGLGNTGTFHNDKYTHSFGASTISQYGPHTITFGFDFRYIIFNDGDQTDPTGSFSFTPNFTNVNPGGTVVGSVSAESLADFLLGYPSSGSIYTSRPSSTSSINVYRVTDLQKYGALFVQDNWRTGAKLTLNLGLRYDVEDGPTEKHNRFATFDPNIINPISAQLNQTIPGGISFRGAQGNSTHFWNTYWTEFSPRIGFAYAFNEKTVLRGGFGFLNIPTTQRLYGSNNYASEVETPYTANLAGSTTIPSSTGLSNPFPYGLNLLPGVSQGPEADFGTDVAGLIYGTPYSYVEQWHANLQQDLGNEFTFSLGYTGSHGVKLPITFDANDLLPQNFGQAGTLCGLYVPLPATQPSCTSANYGGSTYQQYEALTKDVRNPYYGLPGASVSGEYASNSIPNYHLMARFPQYLTATEQYVGQGGSSYNSLQLIVRKRWRNGTSVYGGYVWSKSRGDVSNLTTGFMDTGTPDYQNSYLPKGMPGQPWTGERSYSTNDVPQRLTLTLMMRVPYGHGQKFGYKIPSWEQAILGNWQLNLINTMQSGLPIHIGEDGQDSFGGNRPMRVPGVAPMTGGSVRNRLGGNYSTNGYFNPAAFATTEYFQLGNVPRVPGWARAEGIRNSDVSLFKIARLSSEFTMQMRAELFNAWNRVQFAAPAATFEPTESTNNFGNITAQANQPRTLQLAVRIVW